MTFLRDKAFEIERNMWAFRETKEYKEYKLNPTKENKEKALAKRRELIDKNF